MSWSNPIPSATPINTAGLTNDIALSALQAKYTDASNWATWAATLLESQLSGIKSAVSTDITTSNINPLLAMINSAPPYTSGNLAFTNKPFSDELLTQLRNKLSADISQYSTGLGDQVETAMFNRAVARIDVERDRAYAELNDSFSQRGFDIPPGTLLSKQTEITNESTTKLNDINANILHESATLALNYNIEMLKIATGVIDLLGRLNNDEQMRNFEIQKVAVMQALDAYKAQLALFETKGKLIAQAAQLTLDSLGRSLTVEVEAFKGVAQSAAQMVAGAINSVNSSTSYGFGSSESKQEATGIHYTMSGEIDQATVSLVNAATS